MSKLLSFLLALWLHIVAFVKEAYARLKSEVPVFWRRLQILAGSVAVMAGFMLKFEQHLTAEIVPYLHHALTGGLLVAGTSQLACKDKEPSPTAALEHRLNGILPDSPTPPAAPSTEPEA